MFKSVRLPCKNVVIMPFLGLRLMPSLSGLQLLSLTFTVDLEKKRITKQDDNILYLLDVVFIYTTHLFTFHNRSYRSFIFAHFWHFPSQQCSESLPLESLPTFFQLVIFFSPWQLGGEKTLLTMRLIGTLVLFFVCSIQLIDIQRRSAAILFCLLISSLHPRGLMSRLDRQARERETLGFCFLIDKNVRKPVDSGTDMFMFNIPSRRVAKNLCNSFQFLHHNCVLSRGG